MRRKKSDKILAAIDEEVGRMDKESLRKFAEEIELDRAARAKLGGYLDEAEAHQDRELILRLLRGVEDFDAGGWPILRYPEAGSIEEHTAREALARLLRSNIPLDHSIRGALANLIDPDSFLIGHRTRQIQIKTVGKKGRADGKRYVLAEEVWQALRKGSTVEAAQAEIAEKYRIHEKTVMNAWMAFKHFTSAWERDSDD